MPSPFETRRTNTLGFVVSSDFFFRCLCTWALPGFGDLLFSFFCVFPPRTLFIQSSRCGSFLLRQGAADLGPSFRSEGPTCPRLPQFLTRLLGRAPFTKPLFGFFGMAKTLMQSTRLFGDVHTTRGSDVSFKPHPLCFRVFLHGKLLQNLGIKAAILVEHSLCMRVEVLPVSQKPEMPLPPSLKICRPTPVKVGVGQPNQVNTSCHVHATKVREGSRPSTRIWTPLYCDG